MKTSQPERHTLSERIASAGLSPRRFLADAAGRVALDGTSRDGAQAWPRDALRGRSVLISSERQLPAVLALLHLDGVAARLVLCPPDLAAVHLPAVIATAQVDAIVSDGTGPATDATCAGIPVFACPALPLPSVADDGVVHGGATEWLLFTSGTTGQPKLVVHTLSSLSGPLDDGLTVAPGAVWSTFYDVRRYGGLQILLRALLGGGSMVLSQAGEPVGEFLARAGAAGVTHMSGTPSHWRRALMSPGAGRMSPRYIRLSGEVADQTILNSLAAAFPGADIAHAFASTEAGVAFDVRDGLAGFPAAMVGVPGAKAEMRIKDGSLRIRSPRTAQGYLGAGGTLADADGFVDTGDMVELRGDRYYFVGRREGVINVGGQKVHPEEVEAVINRHPKVQMARVRGRPNPITGALVVADIVVRPSAEPNSFPDLREEILAVCREMLPTHKVPTMLREVAKLDIAESGKLLRHNA
jgi:acyl-CoA synthetase (AMP-forming)/AMP-acid ligase II